jgi:hypothetical protein
VLAGGGDLALDDGAERKRRRGGGDESPVTELPSDLQRTVAHVERLRVVERIQPVDGELDLEGRRLDGAAAGQLLPRP